MSTEMQSKCNRLNGRRVQRSGKINARRQTRNDGGGVVSPFETALPRWWSWCVVSARGTVTKLTD